MCFQGSDASSYALSWLFFFNHLLMSHFLKTCVSLRQTDTVPVKYNVMWQKTQTGVEGNDTEDLQLYFVSVSVTNNSVSSLSNSCYVTICHHVSLLSQIFNSLLSEAAWSTWLQCKSLCAWIHISLHVSTWFSTIYTHTYTCEATLETAVCQFMILVTTYY